MKTWLRDSIDVFIMNAKICKPIEVKEVSSIVEGSFTMVMGDGDRTTVFSRDGAAVRWNDNFTRSVEQGVAEVLTKNCIPVLDIYVEAEMAWCCALPCESKNLASGAECINTRHVKFIQVRYRITPPDDTATQKLIDILDESQDYHTSTDLKQSIAQAIASKQNLRLALQDIVQLGRPRKEWFQVDVEKDDDEATSTTEANTTTAYKQLRTTTRSNRMKTCRWRLARFPARSGLLC